MIARGAVVLDVGALAEPDGWIDPGALRSRAACSLHDLPPGGAVQVLLGSTRPLPATTALLLLELLEDAEVGVVSVLGSRADAVADILAKVNARTEMAA